MSADSSGRARRGRSSGTGDQVERLQRGERRQLRQLRQSSQCAVTASCNCPSPEDTLVVDTRRQGGIHTGAVVGQVVRCAAVDKQASGFFYITAHNKGVYAVHSRLSAQGLLEFQVHREPRSKANAAKSLSRIRSPAMPHAFDPLPCRRTSFHALVLTPARLRLRCLRAPPPRWTRSCDATPARSAREGVHAAKQRSMR